jgi:SpoIIAA-like
MPVFPLSAHDATVIRELEDLPTGVIGFEASGTLKAEDYRDVIVPALERASSSGEVRFVIVIPEFDGMSGGALWEDLKLGIENLRAWKRIALVTDIEWMKHVTRLFGWMTPGELRQFPLARRADAIAWAAARHGTEHSSEDGASTGT